MSASQSPFLSLAPATSATFPQAPKKAASAGTPLTASALSTVPVQQKERTSSMSSDGSDSSKPSLRFLKLGPVHFGEHADGQRADWSEVLVGESL